MRRALGLVPLEVTSVVRLLLTSLGPGLVLHRTRARRADCATPPARLIHPGHTRQCAGHSDERETRAATGGKISDKIIAVGDQLEELVPEKGDKPRT